MDTILATVLRAHQPTAASVLAFIEGPQAPTSWEKVWSIDDRIAHLVQDAPWCAAVAELSRLGQAPNHPDLLAVLAHEKRAVFASRRGTLGMPDYWGDLGRAVELVPEGHTLDLTLSPDGRTKVRISGPAGKVERRVTSAAAGVCWAALSLLAKSDPTAASVRSVKPADTTYTLDAGRAA